MWKLGKVRYGERLLVVHQACKGAAKRKEGRKVGWVEFMYGTSAQRAPTYFIFLILVHCRVTRAL